jgi:mono/diheme cytochrome c family protein
MRKIRTTWNEPRHTARRYSLLIIALVFLLFPHSAVDWQAAVAAAADAKTDRIEQPIKKFLVRNCADCHGDGAAEGGFELDELGVDLTDVAIFTRWEQIYDRVDSGEMPPEEADQPANAELDQFTTALGRALVGAHRQRKGTVLRRLNRREYENTLNDLFGTDLDLAAMLPEDGRSHEFDNIGDALGLSMVHMQRYMEAAQLVLDAAIATTTKAPEPNTIVGRYSDDRGSDQFIGTVWKQLADGAVVRFEGGGYPSGMMRSARASAAGKYRIRVRGYAHQSREPITFSVGSTTFARGAEKPIYGFYSVPPDEPTTIELTALIGKNYMIQIEPYGISDPERYTRKREGKSIDQYDGPGLAILEVTLEGPLIGEFPSRGHRLIFDGIQRREIPPHNPAERKKPWYRPRFEVLSSNPRGDASQSLARVAQAAFRRPVAKDEVEHYVELFEKQCDQGASFEEALRTAIIAVLCSPRFLYLQESPGRLDDYALAVRLSYFLTRSAPDKQLLEIASTGELTADPQTLRSETERLLRHPHRDRFITDLADAWLNLREIDFTAPDESLFPEYDSFLRFSMPLETYAFLEELIDENLPVRNLVKSDFAMLNSRLAAHYDLPTVSGAAIRKVVLPADSLRGGLLTQASVLKVTANGTNSSPVTRGVWVLERILGQTPPPPPPGVPGVEPDIRGASTLRELLDKHRSLVSCRACHQKIDPPGFALESFNPIGGFRQRYRVLGSGEKTEAIVRGRAVRYRLGSPVDSSGQFADGQEFDGYPQFRDALVRDPNRLCETVTKKLLTFAMGRELGFSDRAVVERIVSESAKEGYGMRDLIHLVVESEVFRSK